MSILKELLTEKLRPKTLNEIILLDRVRNSIGEGILNQHICLHGTAGVGKTSLAKILVQDSPYLYINVSADRGIDTVREEIVDFCSNQSLIESKSGFKIIIMDELDGATETFFKALRAVMEKYAKNVRFIATCNYLNKIPDPIQSRFLILKFTPENQKEELELLKKYKDRIEQVSKKLNLAWESKEILEQFMKKYFPDLRHIYSRLQDFHTHEIQTITLDNVKSVNFGFQELYKLIFSKPNPIENYKYIMGNFTNNLNEVYLSFSQEFPEWLQENKKDKESKLPQLLVTMADWDYKRNFMIDPILSLLACVYQCQQLINS